MDPYLKKCGGLIYSKCDDATQNQETVFQDAQEKAKAGGLDLMVVIGADWCPACKSFRKMIENDNNKEDLFKKVVLVEINGDASSARTLAKKLDITYVGYPQAFIFDPDPLKFKKAFFPSTMFNVNQLITNLDLKNSKKEAQAKPSSVGSVLVKTLELPIELNGDYGKSYFISSPKDDYERFINQGISALHLFQYVDSFRSFQMAAKVDPDRVMAYVGQILSILEISKYEGAFYFVDLALDQIARIEKNFKLSEKEKGWIEAVRAVRLNSSSSYTNKDKEGVLSVTEALRKLRTESDPENLDGISLFTWLNSSILSPQETMKVFELALKKNPDSVGPRHYLLHMAERRNDPRDAETHGSILKDLAPGSGHAIHMYGHTLPQKGKWKEAVHYFKKAHDIHLKWAEKYKVDPAQDWHYSHNLDLLAAAYLGLGNLEKASESWEKASNYDGRAILHYLGLEIIKGDYKKADQLLSKYEGYSDSWKTYLAPLREELDLTQDQVRQARVRTIPGDSDSYESLMVELKNSFAEGQPLNLDYYSRLNTYFSNRFQAGGFDGWSNAYLELLRMKRVAKILSLEDFELEMKPLEMTVKSGALCGNGSSKSLVKCMSDE
ncbi:MAG: hypothetical protein GW917_00230 [Bdellovibrionales bacterium]|nr:hypothetical protein [Bdellovibrionales bacterium]